MQISFRIQCSPSGTSGSWGQGEETTPYLRKAGGGKDLGDFIFGGLTEEKEA